MYDGALMPTLVLWHHTENSGRVADESPEINNSIRKVLAQYFIVAGEGGRGQQNQQ